MSRKIAALAVAVCAVYGLPRGSARAGASDTVPHGAEPPGSGCWWDKGGAGAPRKGEQSEDEKRPRDQAREPGDASAAPEPAPRPAEPRVVPGRDCDQSGAGTKPPCYPLAPPRPATP